jgi:hypothetical protein
MARPLPDVVFLLVNSIARAALARSLNRPEVERRWVEAVEAEVKANGKLSKFAAAYVSFHPPPAFWPYYCGRCLPGEERVFTPAAANPIREITPGSPVLGHDGKLHPVLAVGRKPYDGELLTIRPQGGVPVALTPEHPVLTARGWVAAADITPNDQLLFPIPTGVQEVRYVPAKLELPGYLEVTPSLLRLIGYYAAEGSLSGTKGGKWLRVVTLSFNAEKDGALVEDALSIARELEIGSWTEKKGKSIRVDLASSYLARWLESSCGRRAVNKRLPDWTLLLPPEQQREIIKAAWLGDGTLNKRTPGWFSYTSISPTLALQMRVLLLRQGIYSAFAAHPPHQRNKQTAYTLVVERPSSFNKLAQILGVDVQKPPSWECRNTYLADGYLYSGVRSVQRKAYRGEVFDLQVAEAESFATPSFAVHNCRWWVDTGDPAVGRCSVVESSINFAGWCALWTPPPGEPIGSWLTRYPQDLPRLLAGLAEGLRAPLGREKVLPAQHFPEVFGAATVEPFEEPKLTP